MKKPDKFKVDIATWNRKDHYNFFKNFDQPFFGITTTINCTEAYNYCKAYQVSFFVYYLHKSLLAANCVKEFKLRMEAGNVLEYENISGSVTVLRKDETFGFAYFNFHRDFNSFARETLAAIELEKMAAGLQLKAGLNSLIHYSVLTGINFSSMQHAQQLYKGDSVPKIMFGKLIFDKGLVLLPVSVSVHHALCDGLHVTRFIEAFQQKMQITN